MLTSSCYGTWKECSLGRTEQQWGQLSKVGVLWLSDDNLAGTRPGAEWGLLQSSIFFATFLLWYCKAGDIPVLLTETVSASHWCFVAQFTLDAISPLFYLSSHFQKDWMSFPIRTACSSATGFGFIFLFTSKTAIWKVPSLLKYQHKWL